MTRIIEKYPYSEQISIKQDTFRKYLERAASVKIEDVDQENHEEFLTKRDFELAGEPNKDQAEIDRINGHPDGELPEEKPVEVEKQVEEVFDATGKTAEEVVVMIKKFHIDKPVDTTKRNENGDIVHQNTDIEEIYGNIPKIKEEIKAKKEKEARKAFITQETFDRVKKLMNYDYTLDEFKKKFFVIKYKTEILFSKDNPMVLMGGIVAYRDDSGYDLENPIGTIRCHYVTNFSREDEIQNKDFTVTEPPEGYPGHKRNLNRKMPAFYVDDRKIIQIVDISSSKVNYNHID